MKIIKMCYIFILLFIFSCQKKEPILPIEPNPEKDKLNYTIEPFLEEQLLLCVPQFLVTPADSSIFTQRCSGRTDRGIGNAFREDHYWNASGSAGRFGERIELGLVSFTCDDTIRGAKEMLFFNFSIHSKSCISLNAPSNMINANQGTASFRYVDYDVTHDRFAAKKDENNLLEITRLDTINNIVEGRFMITLQRSDELDFDSIGPEVFSFVNGEFSCKITN